MSIGESGADRRSILIAIPTTGRTDSLAQLLGALASQAGPAAKVELAVVDNGSNDHAQRIVESARDASRLQVGYLFEPERGIPFARNACVRMALERSVDALVFVDDDEWPAPGWLNALLTTWCHTDADIVLGPAKGILPDNAPRWARYSGIFDKDRCLPDGAPLRTAYSYNTLVSRRVLEVMGPTFDSAFRYSGSSDHHYFKQATTLGFRSVWSPDALVYEQVDPCRLHLSWVLRRGYRIGVGARRSTSLRIGGIHGVLRIVSLFGANLAYAAWQMLRSLRYRWSWVEGLKRLGIAGGLVGGSVYRYEEYQRH